jgi:hypothetical protein
MGQGRRPGESRNDGLTAFTCCSAPSLTEWKHLRKHVRRSGRKRVYPSNYEIALASPKETYYTMIVSGVLVSLGDGLRQ